MMAARFFWTSNLMYCLRGEKGYPIFQTQETNRNQGFLLQEIIPNACLAVIAVIFQMWNTSVSSFMNKVFQLASNTIYSTLQGIISSVCIVFCRAFMCLPSSRRADVCALVAWLIVLIATLIPVEGAALPTTCPAACLNSLEHYCKEVFGKSECRQCRVTCSNPNNWNECEENCKGSQFYPVEATTAGEPFVATPSVTPDASTTSSPVVSNTVGGPTGFERGSEYYPVDATTGEVSTAAPNNDIPQSVPVWLYWIIISVAFILVLVILVTLGILVTLRWNGGCTGSPGVKDDKVSYKAVGSKDTTTSYVGENNSTVPVHPSEESNEAEGGCTGSPGVKGDTRKDGVTVSYKAVDSKVTTTFVREKNSTVPVQPSEESNQAEAAKYQTAQKENSTVPVHPTEESNQADAICSCLMAVSDDPMNTEMHPVDQERSGE